MHFKQKYVLSIVSLILSASLLMAQEEKAKSDGIKVLIIDGQNNHVQWPKLSYMIQEELVNTGLFEVSVERTAFTWKGEEFISLYPMGGAPKTEALEKPKSDPNFNPDFSKYDVVVCNFGWNAAPWPEKTQKDFEVYMKNGGGLVLFHAADNSFPQWPAYNEMIGLGGWGDRNEKDGPYVYYNDHGDLIRDNSPGKAGAHGPQSEYVVQIRNSEHPITKDLPLKWMHAKDELYHSLRGPAKNMDVLATAYAPLENKGTGRHEPTLMAINYGKGRIFHSIMGHVDYSISCVGFLTTFLRGTEWAATGQVTLPVPDDFPTESTTSSRELASKD